MMIEDLLQEKRPNGQTYESSLLQLGAGAGRQYDTPSPTAGGRFNKLRHEIHDGSHVSGCRMCSALHESDSPIIPHESEINVPGGY